MVAKKFEETNVEYIFNTVSSIFFKAGFYPWWDIVEGKPARLKEPPELQLQARDIHSSIQKILDKRKRGVRVPHTLISMVTEADAFVVAMWETKGIPRDWIIQYFRLLRYFERPSSLEHILEETS